MFETIVIDNLLSEQDQIDTHNIIMQRARWKFLNDVTGNEKQPFPSYGFVDILKYSNTNITDMYNVISVPIVEALRANNIKFKDVYYNRMFLQLPLAPQYKKEHNGVHVDLPIHIPHVACVYYVNDSDGDTIIYEQTINDTPGGSQGVVLKEHKRVTPKRGRAVLFDGSRYHCSSQPTIGYRTIINFDLTI